MGLHMGTADTVISISSVLWLEWIIDIFDFHVNTIFQVQPLSILRLQVTHLSLPSFDLQISGNFLNTLCIGKVKFEYTIALLHEQAIVDLGLLALSLSK